MLFQTNWLIVWLKISYFAYPVNPVDENDIRVFVVGKTCTRLTIHPVEVMIYKKRKSKESGLQSNVM